MKLEKNKFSAALATNTTQYGFWLSLPDNSIAEMAAATGFDWLLIDHEHGPFELRDIMTHLQAMAPYGVAPIVRPASDDPVLLKKMLDIGVQSLLIPMVDTAEQAAAIVSAVRYPPGGTRGLGTSMARAAKWNMVPGYVQVANGELCLIVQVETATAMENLEAILAVEGVDGVFIGPSDLSASMGHIGDAGHPEVVAAISSGLESVCAAGKHAGLLCLDPDLVQTYVAGGANFVGVGVDTLVLTQGMRAIKDRFKKSNGSAATAPHAGY